MRKPNEINGGRGVMISEKTVLDLEGRCSIQLSYGRSQRNISGWPASAQAWLSGGGLERPGEVVERIALFGRTLFLAVKEFQKGAGRKDAKIAMLFEGEQIGVAGDDAFRASRQGGGQHPIIIRIATNRRGKFCGFDGFRPFGKHGQQRHFIRGKIKFDAQLFPQFAKQNFRGDDGVGPQPHADEIAAHAVGHHGGNQNIGVEDEPHEMILKTSSSV